MFIFLKIWFFVSIFLCHFEFGGCGFPYFQNDLFMFLLVFPSLSYLFTAPLIF